MTRKEFDDKVKIGSLVLFKIEGHVKPKVWQVLSVKGYLAKLLAYGEPPSKWSCRWVSISKIELQKGQNLTLLRKIEDAFRSNKLKFARDFSKVAVLALIDQVGYHGLLTIIRQSFGRKELSGNQSKRIHDVVVNALDWNKTNNVYKIEYDDKD